MSDPAARLNAALSGRYRIERELGVGGMAKVYLAEDLRHERKVALKVLKPELAAVVGAERFLAEIKTTANLQHPHILPLHDSGEADGFLFYVMPHVEGESLRARLDREHQLPVKEAVRIATAVASALDYAHRHGVIHRDIKPANILLHDGEPVVADFGIALAVNTAGGGRVTETGLSLGTPHYMSPEQATGDQSVGPATDIWALGCVLYEMLVGEPPYRGSTPQAILGKVITSEPDPVTTERKSVPANVEAVVRKALEKVPADRFTGMRALADALVDPSFQHMPAATPHRAKRRLVAGVALAATAAVAIATWHAWLGPAEVGTEPSSMVPLRAVLRDNPSVAILPFTNLGAEEDLPFVDGLHDDILTALGKVRGLTTISRTSVLGYRDDPPPVSEIASALQVDAVGEGSVSRAGNRIRVNVQLINGVDEGHMWAESYDRELTASNVFDVRDEVATAIAGELHATLTRAEVRRVTARPTTSLTAYEWMQVARSSGFAIEYIRKALEADSLYANAWAELGRRYALRVMNEGAPQLLLDSAIYFADRAAALDPDNDLAYHVRGIVVGCRQGMTYYMRTIELNPGRAGTWNNIGFCRARSGDFAEAVDAFRRAIRLGAPQDAFGNLARLYARLGMHDRADDVLDAATAGHISGFVSRAYTLALRGSLEEARRVAEAAVAAYPTNVRSHMTAAAVAVLRDDLQQARARAETAYALRPESPRQDNGWPSVRLLLGFALLRTGERVRAEEVFNELEAEISEKSNREGVDALDLAAVAALRGDAVEARRIIRDAYQDGNRYSVPLRIDPMFASLRGDREFEEILRRTQADLDEGRRGVLRMEADLGEAAPEEPAGAPPGAARR